MIFYWEGGGICLPHSELADQYPPGELPEFHLSLDALGLMDEAVEPLHVVVNPPFRGTFDMARIDIETAAESLIDGLVATEHLAHEHLLFGRAHGHEHDIGAFLHDVGNQRFLFFRRGKIAVAVAGNADIGELRTQL